MSTFPIDDATLMTFAGIAYGEPTKIPEYLKKSSQISDHWSCVWMPGATQNPDNLAYVALNETAGQCVVAIRGTYPHPFSPIYWENGKQDSPFGPMQPWPVSTPGGREPKISNGTNTGFGNLVALKNADGQTLEDAIASLDPSVSVTVTGHSLGGTLTPVIALRLAEKEPNRAVYSVSFAGMTPGNKAFAALCGPGGALSGRTRRVHNTLDSVGYGWNDVLATWNFFKPNPRGGWLVRLFLVISWFRLTFGPYGYAPIGENVPLQGTVSDPTATGILAYTLETLRQHMPDTYLKLLGAPPLPFSILTGNIIADRDTLEDTVARSSNLPVFHL